MTEQLGHPPVEEAVPPTSYASEITSRRPGPRARFPFDRLVAAMGVSPNRACVELGISGTTAQEYRALGVTECVADRLAVRAGFHPYEIWPELVDHTLAKHERQLARRRQLHQERRAS